MPSDSKIKIEDLSELYEKLKKVRASLVLERTIVDTYFNQPKGTVLKLREEYGKPIKIVHFKETPHGIESLPRPSFPPGVDTRVHLLKEYGVHSILDKKVSLYKFPTGKVSLHRIEKLGDFLVLESGDRSLITETLGYKNSDFFSTPFNLMLEESEHAMSPLAALSVEEADSKTE